MSEKEKNKQITEANRLVDQGEYYKAAQKASNLLALFPQDPSVKALSTSVESRQAERYRGLRASAMGAPELTIREKADAIQTLNERAEEYYQNEKYDEARETVQEVFQYEPSNAQASRLMDKLGQKEREQAEKQTGMLREVYRDEMTERMEIYRKEAKRMIEEQRFGRARFALEKMLLLDSKDPEANRLYETVLHQLEKKAA